MNNEPTTRFTNRAGYYARNRPGYPDEVLGVLEREAGLTPHCVIADVGAGTGIPSELFLRYGCQVMAIEPNADMRAEAAALTLKYPSFRLLNATAEQTTLAEGSVDVVLAATAFHWFDRELCREEFRRVLKPGGHVVLLWNERPTGTGFPDEYERLLGRFGRNYKQSWSRQGTEVNEACTRFFAPRAWRLERLPNGQELDFDGLRERLLSSSYAPLPGDTEFDAMTEALQSVFDEFQTDGVVVMGYETSVYWGQLP